MDFVHYGIARIDTLRATDTFQLQALASIDAGWTNRNTRIAVNA